VRSPTAHTRTPVYDAQGDLAGAQDDGTGSALPTDEVLVRDRDGRVLESRRLGGASAAEWIRTVVSYDHDGRLLTRQVGTGATTTWTYTGALLTSVSTDNGASTTYAEYHPSGQPQLITVAGTPPQVTRVVYDGDGREVRRTVGASVWTTVYDPLTGAVAEVQGPGTRTRYQRDARGRVTRSADGAGRGVTVGYDDLDRRISATHDGAPTRVERWRYLQDTGLVTRYEDGAGQVTERQYRSDGSLAEETVTRAGISRTITHGTDAVVAAPRRWMGRRTSSPPTGAGWWWRSSCRGRRR
jgi:YD repeat-containing protein